MSVCTHVGQQLCIKGKSSCLTRFIPISVAVILSLFSNSSFAYVTNSTSCNNSGLGNTASSGSATVNAVFEANEIDLVWYNDGAEIANAQGSCVYDSTITPPTLQSKTGYTFGGWTRVNACPANTFTNLDPSIYTTYDADFVAWKPINGSNGSTVAQELDNGYLAAGEDRSSELDNNGEYLATLSYGTIKGLAKCSETNGGYRGSSGNPSDTEGANCWCSVIGFTPAGGEYCSSMSKRWAFYYRYGQPEYCLNGCARDCTSVFTYANTEVKATMFGQN